LKLGGGVAIIENGVDDYLAPLEHQKQINELHNKMNKKTMIYFKSSLLHKNEKTRKIFLKKS
jgi:hypothetical protein